MTRHVIYRDMLVALMVVILVVQTSSGRPYVLTFSDHVICYLNETSIHITVKSCDQYPDSKRHLIRNCAIGIYVTDLSREAARMRLLCSSIERLGEGPKGA